MAIEICWKRYISPLDGHRDMLKEVQFPVGWPSRYVGRGTFPVGCPSRYVGRGTFPCWMAIEICWKRYIVSSSSLVTVVVRLPISLMSPITMLLLLLLFLLFYFLPASAKPGVKLEFVSEATEEG